MRVRFLPPPLRSGCYTIMSCTGLTCTQDRRNGTSYAWNIHCRFIMFLFAGSLQLTHYLKENETVQYLHYCGI